jgi:Family of unknown function (DUF5317)
VSLLSAIVVGLGLGLALGGRVKNLGQLSLRWNLLIFLSLLIQLALFTGLTVPASLVTVGYLLSGLLSLAWLARNIAVPGMPVVLAGGLSNFLAIAANGGRMPVDAALLAQTRGADFVAALAAGRMTSNSSLANSHTHLRWLTDIIMIPPPWPLPTVLSVGDVLISVGVVWLIAAAMRRSSMAGAALTATPRFPAMR